MKYIILFMIIGLLTGCSSINSKDIPGKKIISNKIKENLSIYYNSDKQIEAVKNDIEQLEKSIADLQSNEKITVENKVKLILEKEEVIVLKNQKLMQLMSTLGQLDHELRELTTKYFLGAVPQYNNP